MKQTFTERRQVPRFSCAATAIIKSPQGPELAKVRVVGLGIAGCRIEIERRLEVDQQLELIIQASDQQIATTVIVRYWHKKGFAGLHFLAMSQEAKERLQRLVDYISRTFAEPEARPRG